MKKESKKKRERVDNIFSPKNILICFIIIIILLLIFNYFYPIFFNYNFILNQDSNNGKLYQLGDPDEPEPDISNEYEDPCENVVCPMCQECNNDNGECVAVPNNPGQQCKVIWPFLFPPIPPLSIPGTVCYDGGCFKQCVNNDDCPVNYVCDELLGICEKSLIVNPPPEGSDHEPPPLT